MALRPYQITGKQNASDAFGRGTTRVLLCMPTGSGKTVTFADMARDAVLNGLTVMVVVDRKELLDQAQKKLLEYGLSPAIITAGRTVKLGASCYVATVQTLVKRHFPPVGLLIIDEAHKQIFDKVLDAYPETYTVGATATPKRSGKMNQLSRYYGELVEPVSINELIGLGYLVPAFTFGAKMDTSKIKTKGDDYDASDMFSAFDKTTLYAGVVDKYRKYADETKAICFCINVEHSKKTAEAFRAAGIAAVHLDGAMPKNEREGILRAFSKGIFHVLCNVEVLTTGYDEWTIETVIVNLATKSLPKWLQMGGRGSRITPAELVDKTGFLQKTHFNLIDMGGNVPRLGFWESERQYSLTHETRDKTDAAPVKECPEDEEDINGRFGCGMYLHATAARCKHCGYVFPEKEKPAPVESEFFLLENYESLPQELVGKAWGSMDLKELEAVRTFKNYSLGWICRLILLNKDLSLEQYAIMRGFKSPAAWAMRMRGMYVKSSETV